MSVQYPLERVDRCVITLREELHIFIQFYGLKIRTRYIKQLLRLLLVGYF